MSDEAKSGAAKDEQHDDKSKPAQAVVELSERDKVRQQALEAVKDRRAELAGTAATESGAADDDKGKSETEGDEPAADDDAEAESQAGEGDEKKDSKARTFTDEEIAKPGFFDSLNKEGWAALQKQNPSMVAMYKAIRADQSKLADKLQKRQQQLEDREAAIKSNQTAAANAETTVEEENELKELGFTGKDVEKLFGSKAAQRIIENIAGKTVKSMGVDPERSEAQVQGFESALKTYPELADDAVWNDVQKRILSDENEAKALDEAKSPAEIRRIIESATGRVVADRAKTTSKTEQKDEKKRMKETNNATKPVSRAVGKPRVAPSAAVEDDAKVPLKERMRAFVEEHKSKQSYKELR